MSPFLVPALLLAALHVLWFFAFLVDARAERHADPIGRIFATWLSREGWASVPERRRWARRHLRRRLATLDPTGLERCDHEHP